MRRVRIELTEVAAIQNLAEATARAARGKHDRPVVRAFLGTLEDNLEALAQDILGGRCPRGEYRQFHIRDPKPRVIHAACFPDRVLHHALMLHAGPVLERAMTDTSYACRPGKGALAAVQAVQSALQRFPWYVKIDVSGYFEHIDHAVLLGLLSRRRRQRYQARRAHWEAAWRAEKIDELELQRGYDAVRAIAIQADSRTWRRNELSRHPAPEV